MEKNIFSNINKEQLDILKYSSNPIAFATDVIGIECKPFHQEWLNAFENNKFTVLLAPRGHGKTTLVGSYIVWRICNDRDIRCIILTINQDKANAMMRFIQENLEHNPKLKRIYGDFRSSTWSRDQIRVLNKGSKSIPHNEPTLKVLGVTSSIISAHYNLIILDDITDDDNSRTDLNRLRLEELYDGPLVGTFLADTKVINIGTKWNENDIHSFLSNKEGFKTIKYQALLNPEEVEEGGKARVLWPEHLPWDKDMIDELNKKLISEDKKPLRPDVMTLKFIREHQGERFFQMQYQNNIIASGLSKFKSEWVDSAIKRYSRFNGILPMNLKRYMGVDLGGEDVKSDWGVSTVIGVDDNGDIYIIDSVRTHSTTNNQFEIMKSLDDKYHTSRIGMESVAQQKHDVSDAARENPHLPIFPIKSSKVNDRDTRTDRLSILFETNRILLNPSLKYLVNELLVYPRGKHDDCIDSLCFAIEASQEGGFIDWNRVADVVSAKRTYKITKI